MAKRKGKAGKRITVKQVQATENQPAPEIPNVEVKPEVDEEPWGDDGLTTRQRMFVAALIGPAGGNATKAASMAGYKDDNVAALAVTACRTLRKANVQRAIAQAVAQKLDSPEWIRNGLVELSSSSLANFIEVNDDGTTELDFRKASAAGALGQIREYREEVLKVGDGPAQTIKRTIKIHDRRAALETLARLEGKITEHHVHTLDLRDLSDDDLHRLREIYVKSGQGADLTGSN